MEAREKGDKFYEDRATPFVWYVVPLPFDIAKVTGDDKWGTCKENVIKYSKLEGACADSHNPVAEMSPENSNAATPRIIIVDDHPLLRLSVKKFLEASNAAEVVADVSDATTLISLVETLRPDVILMDVAMPNSDGIVATREIKKAFPSVKVLVFSGLEEEFSGMEALQAGASGFLSKGLPPETIIEAIRKVHAGGLYLSDEMSKRFLNSVVGSGSVKETGSVKSLTNRQLQVFTCIGQGLSLREIAARFGISLKTVEALRHSIKRKLGTQGTPDLTRHAVEWLAHHPEISREGCS